jgi:hypothetical protein
VTDGQSVSMSWRRVHLGTCDQILSEFCYDIVCYYIQVLNSSVAEKCDYLLSIYLVTAVV